MWATGMRDRFNRLGYNTYTQPTWRLGGFFTLSFEVSKVAGLVPYRVRVARLSYSEDA